MQRAKKGPEIHRGRPGRIQMHVRCQGFGSQSTRRLQLVAAPVALKSGVFRGYCYKNCFKNVRALYALYVGGARARARACVRVCVCVCDNR